MGKSNIGLILLGGGALFLGYLILRPANANLFGNPVAGSTTSSITGTNGSKTVVQTSGTNNDALWISGGTTVLSGLIDAFGNSGDSGDN